MIEQHELAFAILKWVGILSLPTFYIGLYIAIIRADRAEAALAKRAETE